MGNSNVINKIDEGFYICGVAALGDFDRLRSLGIQSILNAAQDNLYRSGAFGPQCANLDQLPDNFEVKIIGADDFEGCNLSVHFHEIADFIEAGKAKGGVVVHCAAGVSRASTSACAYLMIKENWDLNSAFRKVHTARNIVQPNRGFWRQLRDLEASLEAQGVQFRQLPADYEAPAQPPKGEDAEERGYLADADCQSVLTRLDMEARQMQSFVTQYLTAILTPDEKVSPEGLLARLERIRMPGVKLESIQISGKDVRLRAGIVPSADSKTLQTMLQQVPGVSSVICE